MQTLKDAREQRGIKLEAVAKAIQVTRQTYAKYEKEPWKMPVQRAQNACAFIGVPMDEIFFSK